MGKKRKAKVPRDSTIDASPVKSFFVEMLTRDISLQDAILDLLDNCVDGILRTKRGLRKNRPYDGYGANIHIDKDSFCIEDNCGGIPWELHEYAFRMGRPKKGVDKGIPTVGVYGIGMKRAIFKMGKDCIIATKHRADSYEVAISEEWMNDPNSWNLPVVDGFSLGEDGTRIQIERINADVASEFADAGFLEKLKDVISTNYAFIIEKGFRVRVNGTDVAPKTVSLKFAGRTRDSIDPYIYKTRSEGVDVFVTVGFTSPIGGDEEDDRVNNKGRSSQDAGWTIICNDRVVVRCDKTELTGWGVSGVPQYHTQFVAIAGIVEFRAKDAGKLPTTTTKRSIDSSSGLYLRVKDKMMEGMKMFTRYTNVWKGRELLERSKKDIKAAPALSLAKIKAKSDTIRMTSTRPRSSRESAGKVFKPKLPTPSKGTPPRGRCVIEFSRPAKEVRLLSEYLYDKEDTPPADVGEKAFEVVLDEARSDNG